MGYERSLTERSGECGPQAAFLGRLPDTHVCSYKDGC
jgi:hypothetical protein